MKINKKTLNRLMFTTFIILFFLFLNTPSISFFFRDPDQGAQLAKAQEILHGYHPFVEIKGNIYGPLVFYISAIGQLLSGNKLIGEVIIILIGYLIAYLTLFYLLENLTKNWYISILLILASLSMLPRFYKYYIVMCPVLFIYALHRYIYNENKDREIIFLSIAIGINSLFRFDFGFYSLITGLISVILLSRDRTIYSLINSVRKIIFMIFAMISPWFIFVVIKGGFPERFVELFSITKGIGSGLSLPIPLFNFSESVFSNFNNFSLLFWFFRIIPFLSLVILFLLKKQNLTSEKKFIFLTSVYSIFIFFQALHRTSLSHLKQVIPITFILIGWMISLLYRKSIKKSVSVKLITVLSLFLLSLGWINYLDNSRVLKKYKKKLKTGLSDYSYFTNSNFELRKKFNSNKYIRVANLVNKFVKKDESVLFIPIESQLYYFSERLFRTELGVLGPGRLDSKKDELDFYNNLIASETNVIVDRPFFYYDKKPERNPRIYYPDLMKKIYMNYKISWKIDDFLILCRDNRFNRSIFLDSRKFISADKDFIYKDSERINPEVRLFNTFKPGLIPKSVKSSSFLFIRGVFPQNDLFSRYRKSYIGLIDKKRLYISDIKTLRNSSSDDTKYSVFSSLVNVVPGRYQVYVFFKKNSFYHGKNIGFLINVLDERNTL